MVNRLTLALGLFAAGSPATSGALPLTPVADVPLPGSTSRFDYQTVDPVSRRLYITHLGDSSLVVFDLASQRVIHEVAGLPSVHGVVAAPEQHLVFATATAEKTLALIDDRTFMIEARVPAGEYPNGLAYDPTSGRVFVSNNSGVGVGVVDVKTARALPESTSAAGRGTRSTTRSRVTCWRPSMAWPLSPTSIPSMPGRLAHRAPRGERTCHGLLVASGLRLAFAACRGDSPTLVVVDLRARRQTMTLPLPSDIDVLAFDPGLARLYAAAETGTVAVFAVADDRAVIELGRGFVGPNAHSVAVDPATHRVYFPLGNVGGRPVLRIMEAAVPPAP